ncbi:MAG: hypothetical protein IPH28_23550 [Cytophagaceae bacterium]|nr:hypothetical protein [Cytophagaceae bacterium]
MNGHTSWILASDDTHDLKKQPAGSYFVGINTEANNKTEVLNALKSGTCSTNPTMVSLILEIDSIRFEKNEVRYGFGKYKKCILD